MKLTLREKTVEFKHLQECDIDVIESQIKNYEKENGELNLESFYKLYIYSDIDQHGWNSNNYDIDIHIQDEDEGESSILISLTLEDTTEKIAREYEDELNKYLVFRFIELAVNNL